MRPGVPLCGSLCPICAQVSLVLLTGGLFDAPLRLVLLAGDAFGVDPQQDVDAVACPLGDLGSGHARVEPGGYRRVSEVVGAPRQQRSRLASREGCSPGLVKDLEIRAVIEDAATGTGEDAPVRSGRVLLDVLGEKRDEFGMDGHRAGLAAGAVLELAVLAG
jgi:hypothetical protein